MPESLNSLNISGILISSLVAVNIFFVKRFISKVDLTDKLCIELGTRLSKLNNDVNSIGMLLREIKVEIKELRKVEIEVAVLKSHFKEELKKS